MIDRDAFAGYLDEYKQVFADTIWPDEKYKWQAVRHFQEHWDPDAEDFAAMVKQSLARTKNLLDSSGKYARGVIQETAEADPEAVRAMFIDLFDEDTDVVDRVAAFKNRISTVARLKDGDSHYQDENSITTYLWLHYPDEHYVYKFRVANDVARALGAGITFKMGHYSTNLRQHQALYDEICENLQRDEDIRELLDGQLADDCYPDPELKTLTVDFGYFLNQKRKKEQQKEKNQKQQDQVAWWPAEDEYDPGLSVDEWRSLLDDPTVFGTSSLLALACFKDIGGGATCTQLSEKYGHSVGFYTGTVGAAAGRVLSNSNAATPPLGRDGEPRNWPVLFTGRKTAEDESGSFFWRLRDEVSRALDQVDLSHLDLHGSPVREDEAHDESAAPQNQQNQQNYWLLIASPRHFSFSSLPVGGEEQWSLHTETGTKRRIYPNFLDVRADDPVIAYESTPMKQIVGLGKFTAATDGKGVPFKKTEGLDAPISFSELKTLPELVDMEGMPNIQGSLFRLTKEQYDAIMAVIRDSNPATEQGAPDPYTTEKFLEEVYTTAEQHDRMINVLRRKKNIILQGAPGVGKTFAAKRLAWSMMGEKATHRTQLVQFHQNYSYEDFMLGYKPADSGFELKKGVFYSFCEKARQQPDLEFFFIIDEINRGNMSKIFGELLMLIENDYRGTEATLAYGDLSFSVPENVHIIGMMNTADRSLSIIDYALRRRFSFIEMEPGFQTDGFKRNQARLNEPVLDRLLSTVEELNHRIAEDPSLGRGFRIGHSYFCGQDSVDLDWLRSVVEFDIVPMLEEYWFDDEEKVSDWTSRLQRALHP